MLMHRAHRWIEGRKKAAGSVGIALWLGISLLLLAGCATPKEDRASEIKLAKRLQSLAPAVAQQDAKRAAETAHAYSVQLARQYRVVRPAVFHNVLVNVGLRERGLCFQWADDIAAKLQSMQLQTLQLRRGVARFGTRREHSSVVLTASGQPFEQGIVLDAWRHSGRLYWGEVAKDKYPWIEVEVIPEEEPKMSAKAGRVQ